MNDKTKSETNSNVVSLIGTHKMASPKYLEMEAKDRIHECASNMVKALHKETASVLAKQGFGIMGLVELFNDGDTEVLKILDGTKEVRSVRYDGFMLRMGIVEEKQDGDDTTFVPTKGYTEDDVKGIRKLWSTVAPAVRWICVTDPKGITVRLTDGVLLVSKQLLRPKDEFDSVPEQLREAAKAMPVVLSGKQQEDHSSIKKLLDFARKQTGTSGGKKRSSGGVTFKQAAQFLNGALARVKKNGQQLANENHELAVELFMNLAGYFEVMTDIEGEDHWDTFQLDRVEAAYMASIEAAKKTGTDDV